MRVFGDLLDRLTYAPSRNTKLNLIVSYLHSVPDPDRGWALAVLTNELPFSFSFRRAIKELIVNKVDSELFRLSRDYIGDTAETVALLWPQKTNTCTAPLLLCKVVEDLRSLDRTQLPVVLENWLDKLDATGRWALLKIITGTLRVGVSARLAKLAVAQAWQKDVLEIDELWYSLTPPYEMLFNWLEGTAQRPEVSNLPIFRPVMLAHPLNGDDWNSIDLKNHLIEWKWDGIRVQLVSKAKEVRLYSRTGDNITASFPDLLDKVHFDGILDGELVIVRDGNIAPFFDLQKRLNRKTVTKKLMDQFPPFLKLYDALELEGIDLRECSLEERRANLEVWYDKNRPESMDLSSLISINDKNSLIKLWSGTRQASIEGLMLKLKTSPYVSGRPKGYWFKWKRTPLTLDCVVMYAQRGSGRRSSLHSDYTFGLWSPNNEQKLELVPVGKAYSGFTENELACLDRWVRNNTVERYGPVRAVKAGLVLEIAFDSVHRSRRHKSGVAMRFPRIHRIRWDKPIGEADKLSTLISLIVE
ncbi:MAG: cisplatin damage response ATP-dependent DNA ligase [Hyphomicrobiaceae bacterium]|nr:cisplatin damage response ATP-dependent DNA ligase [Hyphomicrobiaceae bacterium]